MLHPSLAMFNLWFCIYLAAGVHLWCVWMRVPRTVDREGTPRGKQLGVYYCKSHLLAKLCRMEVLEGGVVYGSIDWSVHQKERTVRCFPYCIPITVQCQSTRSTDTGIASRTQEHDKEGDESEQDYSYLYIIMRRLGCVHALISSASKTRFQRATNCEASTLRIAANVYQIIGRIRDIEL